MKVLKIIILILVFTNSCIVHEVNKPIDMYNDIVDFEKKTKYYLRTIWYQGRKDGFDYFKYVYTFPGEKLYKIKVENSFVDEKSSFQYTEDGKWIRVYFSNILGKKPLNTNDTNRD